MTKKMTAILTLIVFFVSFAPGPAMSSVSALVSAPSVVLLDPASKQILFSKAPNRKQPPASTAKLVTALVVLDYLSLDQWVTVSSRVESVEPTKLYLRAGDQLRVRDLLKALLMKSANDAARALAIEISGSELAFSELMNQKVQSLGARNTRFRNASGLPAEGQYSTAYDMALVMRETMASPIISSILKQKEAMIYTATGRRFYLKNHNKMLWRRSGVIGKTGYTRRARHCFVGYIQRGSKNAVVSVLGSRKLWADLNSLYDHHVGFKRAETRKGLAFGSRGKDVWQLQNALKKAGYFHDQATGFFGPITKRAVIQFQKAKGLSADGVVGPSTKKALAPYF